MAEVPADGRDFEQKLSTQGDIVTHVQWGKYVPPPPRRIEDALPDLHDYKTVEEMADTSFFGGGGLSTMARVERDYTIATVVVTLKAGRGLKAADRGGKSDPYAKMKLNDHAVESKVIKKTVNPVWDQTFVFPRDHMRDLIYRPLRVEIFDDDLLSRDDSLGVANLKLDEILHRLVAQKEGVQVRLA